MTQRRFAQLLALGGLLVIIGVTLVPLREQPSVVDAISVWCQVCGGDGVVDAALNVLLFIPLGWGLRLLGLSTPAVVMVGAVISLSVESLQLAGIPGRDASLSDLVTNTLGTLIGAGLGSRLASLR